MAKELWDAYDREGNLLGFDLVRGEPRARGRVPSGSGGPRRNERTAGSCSQKGTRIRPGAAAGSTPEAR